MILFLATIAIYFALSVAGIAIAAAIGFVIGTILGITQLLLANIGTIIGGGLLSLGGYEHVRF